MYKPQTSCGNRARLLLLYFGFVFCLFATGSFVVLEFYVSEDDFELGILLLLPLFFF